MGLRRITPSEEDGRLASTTEKSGWLEAMQKDFDSLSSKNTGTLVLPPDDDMLIGGMWLLGCKKKKFSELLWFKARWLPLPIAVNWHGEVFQLYVEQLSSMAPSSWDVDFFQCQLFAAGIVIVLQSRPFDLSTHACQWWFYHWQVLSTGSGIARWHQMHLHHQSKRVTDTAPRLYTCLEGGCDFWCSSTRFFSKIYMNSTWTTRIQ